MKFIKSTLATAVLTAAISSNVSAAPWGYTSGIDLNSFDTSGLQLYVADFAKDVVVTYHGHTASFKNKLFLDTFSTDYLFSNHENNHTIGYQVNLGTFATGTSLDFRLNANNGANDFYLGIGSVNNDGLVHAGVNVNFSLTNNEILVGFEDIKGGGDKDYNDMVFSVSNVTVSPVPEASTLAMMLGGLGLVGFMAARRQKTTV